MQGVIEEPNGSNHRGHSYTIYITRTGRISTQIVKHIHATPISAEQYLYKQIRKAACQLEGVQEVPNEAD